MASPSEMQETACRVFINAAHSGDMALVAKLWSIGLIADVDVRSSQSIKGWTALLCAVNNGHIAIAEFLLERGASTESCTYQKFTPLHFATRRGNAEMINLLCRFGADVNAHGLDGVTALHIALAENTTHVVLCLLEHPSIDVLQTDAFGNTSLLGACLLGDENFVMQVVETLNKAVETKRALVNMPDADNCTPLNVAANRGDLSLVVFLIHHGADLDTKTTSNGFSPLNSATQKGHADVVQYLIACGADTETTQTGECTPLVVASKLGFEPIVEMLLEHGAQINHRGIDGFTALFEAALEGHTLIVELLLTHGANPEIRSNEGWTPLVAAAMRGHVQVVQLLIDRGADVDGLAHNHWTALAAAVQYGQTAVCAVLLERGASPTLRTTDGQTVLHLAASRDQQEIIRMLLAAGADPYARDVHGRTAVDVAEMEGYFTTADVVGETAAIEPEWEDRIWPRTTLRELYGLSNTNTREDGQLKSNPPWFIDRSAIAAIELCPHLSTPAAQVSIGTWLGARVLLVEPAVARVQQLRALAQEHNVGTEFQHLLDTRLMLQQFREEVSQLYPLRHPHVIRLYGACHRDEQLFLVMEQPQNGTLQSFVGEHKHRTWAILHEVALGLQYLHERGIVHGKLRGDNILIGDDGLVKLSGFGVYLASLNAENSVAWSAPEVVFKVKPSVEADVYSLGMCIIEAVGGEQPYAFEAAEGENIEELVKDGAPPNKPAAFGAREWELVMQMICFQPRKRLNISDVVRELAAFAQEESTTARGLVNAEAASASDSTQDLEETFAFALSLLSVCPVASEDEADTPESQVFRRLYEAWQASELLLPSSRDLVMPRLTDILMRFESDLEAQASMGIAASFAAQRQHADRIYSFHNEIDHLLVKHGELLEAHAAAGTTAAISSWRDQWYAHRSAELEAFGATLEQVEELDVETCTCLLFELTWRRDAYASIAPFTIQAACSKLRSVPGVHVPSWFVPHYEVAFDAFQSFSRGAFGSVHHGSWMGSRAVIKKVLVEDDTEFQKEAQIWSQLYHPHVLQLFGACHVGQKFLVSEFASHGQLDRYLHSLENKPTWRMREAWRTLHEAALGLQYLHSRGIVHCDLKCNNILIGQDGKAKVSDYGLSRQKRLHVPESTSDDASTPTQAYQSLAKPRAVGAPRWKAPEVLNGAEPTVESDVYSFGMCVVEAVTGEYPWGVRDRDELVSDHVRRGRGLFSKPQGFTEAQWALVVGACHFEPTARLQLPAIVARLHVFAQEASSSVADDTPNQLDRHAEPDAEVVSSWSEEEYTAAALPAALNNLSVGLFGS